MTKVTKSSHHVNNLNFTMSPSQDMKAFHEILQSSKNIIAVAGAGLSAASGALLDTTKPPLTVVSRHPHLQRSRWNMAKVRRHVFGHTQRI